MDNQSPPRLVIPSSSASPISTTNIQTGRPPLWTNSSQRKMTRLYLYTTLPVNKILEVVHHGMSPDSVPKKDSANKKLNALLDKEPRWLKPRTNSDMSRRYEQLTQSPTRSQQSSMSEIIAARPHSMSAPPPSPYDMTHIKVERDVQSATTLDVSPNNYTWSASPDELYPPPVEFPTGASGSPMLEPNAEANYGGTRHGRSISADYGDGSMAERLDRRASRISASSNQTTDSLSRILSDFPIPYRRIVQGLVKRFTVPGNPNRVSMSPIPEGAYPSWLHDHDAPPAFVGRPFPLPGDFLNMDVFLSQQRCFDNSEEHQRRWCMCFARDQIDHSASPWVTAQGVHPDADAVIAFGTVGHEWLGPKCKDAFGNTIFHFLAARGQIELLIRTLQCYPGTAVAQARNTAGQTFLHVLPISTLEDARLVANLLGISHSSGVDIYANDCYGRTFFHILCADNRLGHDLQELLRIFYAEKLSWRDAFNMTPAPAPQPQAFPDEPFQGRRHSDWGFQAGSPSHNAAPDVEDDPIIRRDTHYLAYARHAQQYRDLEDAEGRNGLHCLAMASLSVRSAMTKANYPQSSSPTTDRQTKKDAATPKDLLDSSQERLSFRLELVKRLLAAGVNPNHYDAHGNTPLMAFVAELPEDDDYKTGPLILRALIEGGASLNARNRAGETALHIAVRCGRKLAVRELKTLGANVFARDAAGRSLLTVADAKVQSCRDEAPNEYAHYEACRAWLSGKGYAVQEPTVMEEWGMPRSS